MSIVSILPNTQVVTSVRNLIGPRWLHPHHPANVPHVDSWQNPVCYAEIAKQQVLVGHIVSLQGEEVGREMEEERGRGDEDCHTPSQQQI